MESLHFFHLRKALAAFPPVTWALNQAKDLTIGALSHGPVPQHIAFVMDGNRRFAKLHHIETVEGHNLGFEALARILEVCYKTGVRVVTIYAFSIENFNRTKYEIDHLMEMAKVKTVQLLQHGELFDRYGASVRIIGEREHVKPDVLEVLDRAVEMTKHNHKAVLNVCFNYTSRQEITSAIRSTVKDYAKPLPPPTKRNFSESHIARNIRAQHLSSVSENDDATSRSSSPGNGTQETESDSMTGSTTLNTAATTIGHSSAAPVTGYPDPEKITEETISSYLYTADTPPLDLLVRTSGVERLSDFMMWQCHENTSIEFVECMWPEFDLWHFLPVLLEWQWRQRKQREGRRHLSRTTTRAKVA